MSEHPDIDDHSSSVSIGRRDFNKLQRMAIALIKLQHDLIRLLRQLNVPSKPIYLENYEFRIPRAENNPTRLTTTTPNNTNSNYEAILPEYQSSEYGLPLSSNMNMSNSDSD
ncbi:hypothetical protein BB560_004253, partial [Smittium megazygosporum]